MVSTTKPQDGWRTELDTKPKNVRVRVALIGGWQEADEVVAAGPGASKLVQRDRTASEIERRAKIGPSVRSKAGETAILNRVREICQLSIPVGSDTLHQVSALRAARKLNGGSVPCVRSDR